jgi:hypothetical protein
MATIAMCAAACGVIRKAPGADKAKGTKKFHQHTLPATLEVSGGVSVLMSDDDDE